MSSKPWRDPGGRPAPPMKRSAGGDSRRAGPLISTRVLSAPAQRNLVTGMFVLLQVLKLSADRTLFKLALYTSLDAMFVWMLPILAVPGLNFKSNVNLSLVAALALFNYSVFVSAYWIVVICGLFLRPLEWLLGFGARARSVKGAGLISGKYVVDILPEASASLDTISPLCISSSRAPVYLRLKVNATWPSSVRLSRSELGSTEDFETFEYAKRALSKLPSQPESQTLYLPVSTPGAYYLEGITDDQTGLRVRIQRDRIVIPPCPDVDIYALGDSDVCVGSEFWSEVVATGVPPLNVFVDNAWVTLGAEGSEDDAVQTLSSKVMRPALHVGGLRSEVSKVSDKFGCVLDLGNNAKSATGTVVSLPTASANFKSYALVNDKALAEIYVGGDVAPYTLAIDGPEGEFEISLAKGGRHTLHITKPGTYSLKRVSGKHCAGEASGSFEAFTPPPVSMDVSFETVTDKCAGPTGMNAELKLAGTAPYKVVYRSLHGSRVVNQRTVELHDTESKVQFRPKDAGEYTYEFLSVEDRYGKIALSGDEYRRHQVIAELPGAQFAPVPTQVLCGRSDLSLDINVRGKWPLEIRYSVDDKEEASINTTDETSETLKLPLNLKFDSGTHFVRLLTLTDRNGCVTDLHGARTPDITVRTRIPRASWAHPGEKKSAEPVNMQLPLRADGLTYPATLEYEHRLNGVVSRHKVTLNSERDRVNVNKPGTYKLLGLSDNVCGGDVDSSEVTISLYERPRLHLVSEPAPAMCHASSATIQQKHAEVLIVGEGPYTVLHEVVDPHGHSHTEEIKTYKPNLSFDLDRSVVGEYQHYLWVMDSRYGDFNNAQRSLTFKHHVWTPAEASLLSNKMKIPTCEGELLSKSVPVALKGQPPFQLTLQVGKQTKVINATSASTLDLRRELGEIVDNAASQRLRILDVTDAHGCRSVPGKHSPEVTIQVLPKPVVQEPKKLDYCIGEKVTYPIKGSGSVFDVEYSWRGKKHHATAHGSFERFVNAPGEMRLLSVADEQGCRAPANVSVEVHSPPSSTITEESHFSIYKGESIGLGFAFTGTAPFSFVYTRSVDGVVKERNEVKDVMENNYSITVEEGGEYEIVELHDRFCYSER